ncbi:hypothetical protein AVEN_255145-1 [Araneus ventricosus]|uniref:Uncharacterized protein n=1 Tax=Araneus ventricosus TaxID=182803 RepID=A0A4Y2B9F7_ARAVE|nr:hypothetical protein AVEN_255145-1 [Araneus ventricosus]
MSRTTPELKPPLQTSAQALKNLFINSAGSHSPSGYLSQLGGLVRRTRGRAFDPFNVFKEPSGSAADVLPLGQHGLENWEKIY